MRKIPQLIIGAATSGSGKTTFTTGLLRLLRNKGLRVQPYKCGPDYIDTKYHEFASGTTSVNLDLWLSSKEHVKDIYNKYADKADVCVAEGVMGLFDGYNGMQGSSADVAQTINIPVVLLVNAKSTAYSVAATIYGFTKFCENINVVGVVFNNVASERHFSLLQQACNDVGVECFGFIPQLKELEVPSRHLGLTLDKRYDFNQFADRIASAIEQSVDIDKMLKHCLCDVEEEPNKEQFDAICKPYRVAVASDNSFNFVYIENISKLNTVGEVVFFSPTEDKFLPKCDLLYLPGGYPEFYLKELSANTQMRTQIKEYIESGGKTIAECGGMMYLCESIKDVDGKEYDMVGVFPQKATMENMKLTLGYRTLEVNGRLWKGHEFHYSKIEDTARTNNMNIAIAKDARGKEVATALYRYKNTIAGYTHLYWAESDIENLWK